MKKIESQSHSISNRQMGNIDAVITISHNKRDINCNKKGIVRQINLDFFKVPCIEGYTILFFRILLSKSQFHRAAKCQIRAKNNRR